MVTKLSKKKGGQSADQVSPASFTDFEEAMDAGVDAEEKAERFAIGSKARKYFERSLTLYGRALQLDQRSADAAYNSARVCFLLATTFYNPPASLSTLNESVQLYQKALSLSSPAESLSDDTPNAFYLDVQFNLGAALLALSEQRDEIRALKSHENDNNRVLLIEKAITCFHGVVHGQESVLSKQLRFEQDPQNEGPSSSRMDESDNLPDATGTEDDNNSSDQGRAEYTTSLVTPASALESLYNLHISALALMDSAKDVQSLARAVLISQQAQQRAEQFVTLYPDGEKRCPDGEWLEGIGQFRYAPLATKVAEAAKRVELKSQSVSSMLGQDGEGTLGIIEQEAITWTDRLLTEVTSPLDQSTTAGRAAHKVRIAHLEELGDDCLSLARLRIRQLDLGATSLSEMSMSTKAVSTKAWNLLARSSKALLAALTSLDTSSTMGSIGGATSAVLGSANTSTTTSRRRCSLYSSLSTISLLRTHGSFLSDGLLLEPSIGTLLDNARIYARKGIDQVGLGWVLTYNPQSASDKKAALSHALPHGGVESLRGEVDVLLALLRSLYARASKQGEQGRMQMQTEVQSLCAALKDLTNRPGSDDTGGTPWILILGKSPSTLHVVSLMDQVVGEEGEFGVSDREREFWGDVEHAIWS